MSTEGDSNSFSHNRIAIISDSTTQALKNELILDNLFAFLDPKSFKCCRLVCRLWKRVGNLLFSQKFRICFDFRRYKKKAQAPGPTDLRSFFAQQEIPFNALKLKGRLIWSPTVLSEFFEFEGRFITELTLENVSLAMSGGEGLRSNKGNYPKFDFSTLVGGSINLKSLSISCCGKATTFKLTLDLLSNIQMIDLVKCEIELSGQILKPVQLRFVHVKFYSTENQHVKNILINDFVDLSYLQRNLCLAMPSNGRQLAKLKVDASGTCNLDNLFLFNVEILNSKASSWKINGTADFMDVIIQEKMNMTTRCLDIIRGTCDLHLIPESCAEVYLDNGQLHDEILQTGFILPNVKFLKLRGLEFAKSILPHLNSIFINLVELHLDFFVVGDVNIEISKLPHTLSKVFLKHDGFKFIGDGKKALDDLKILILRDHFN